MTKLEDLTTGTRLIGLAANGVATVESAQWIGQQALKVIFRDGDGELGRTTLISGRRTVAGAGGDGASLVL